MKQEAAGPKYEQLLDEINWTGGVGQPAGVYWLDGRSRIAAHDSPAEAWLLEQGAILVATLLFERDSREGRRPGATVQRVALHEFHELHELRETGLREAESTGQGAPGSPQRGAGPHRHFPRPDVN